LLGAGADVDTKASVENGRTTINGAAELGRIDMVPLFLDNSLGSKPLAELKEMCEKGEWRDVLCCRTAAIAHVIYPAHNVLLLAIVSCHMSQC
jgi:hypothetical protein